MTPSTNSEISDERLAELKAKAAATPYSNLRIVQREAYSIITELLSRRSASNAGGVEVKALEWEFGQRTAEAAVPFGEYQVAEYTEADGMGYVATFNDAMEIGEFPTSDAAIAACQSHYEKNTLSSLHPTEGAEPVAWREAYERLMNWLLRYPKFTLGDLEKLEQDLGPFVREPGNSPTVAIPHPSSPVSAEVTEAWWPEGPFKFGDRVEKPKGSSWHGKVCGWYTTSLTPVGYCVESEREPGSVQLYPVGALAAINGGRDNG